MEPVKKTTSLSYLYSTGKGHQNSFKQVCLLDVILKMGKRQENQTNLPYLYIPSVIIHSSQAGMGEYVSFRIQKFSFLQLCQIWLVE